MKKPKFSYMIVLVLFIIPVYLLYLLSPGYSQTKTTTERGCAVTKNAEILWDLSKHRWVCCVPEDEELETCIPITDMKPLPKTSLKPLPPPGKKTIVIPADDPN